MICCPPLCIIKTKTPEKVYYLYLTIVSWGCLCWHLCLYAAPFLFGSPSRGEVEAKLIKKWNKGFCFQYYGGLVEIQKNVVFCIKKKNDKVTTYSICTMRLAPLRQWGGWDKQDHTRALFQCNIAHCWGWGPGLGCTNYAQVCSQVTV